MPFLRNHGVSPIAIHPMNIHVTYAHFFTRVNQCFHTERAIKRTPIRMLTPAIVWISDVFSMGIQTFIFAQRLPPVNTPINIAKNPVNQRIPRFVYDISARKAMISISVVNFILNAKPTIIPTIHNV